MTKLQNYYKIFNY